MNEILHANIFFLIASIATVCFCIFVCVILYQVIKMLQTVRTILDRIAAGSEVIAQDLADIRQVVREGGVMTRLFALLFGSFSTTPKKRKRTNNRNSYETKEDSSEEGGEEGGDA